MQNLGELLPIVYTPTVGDACKEWGTLLPRPTGLYVSMRQYDEGRVQEVVDSWPEQDVSRSGGVCDSDARLPGLPDEAPCALRYVRNRYASVGHHRSSSVVIGRPDASGITVCSGGDVSNVTAS